MKLAQYTLEASRLMLDLVEEKRAFEQLLIENKVKPEFLDSEEYLKCLPLILHITYIQHFHLPDADIVRIARHKAFKLVALFGSDKEARQYLMRFEKLRLQQGKVFSLDFANFDIPMHESVDYALWQQIIVKQNPSSPQELIFRVVVIAHKIQEYVAEHKMAMLELIRTKLKAAFPDKPSAQLESEAQSKAAALLAPTTHLNQLVHYATQVCYSRQAENPEAAQLFFTYHRTESCFEDYLRLKPADDPQLIPDVRLDGSLFGDDNYVIYKLNSADPRAALLGKMTSCCQYLDDEQGNKATIYGITNPSAGFYVLVEKKTDTIVAQSLAWNQENTIVLDSLESQFNIRNKNKQVLASAFRYLAQFLVRERGIYAVNLGLSGGTLSAITLEEGDISPLFPRHLPKGLFHNDSFRQRILAHSIFPFDALKPERSRTTSLRPKPVRWTKAALQEFSYYLWSRNLNWSTDFISDQDLEFSGLTMDDCQKAMDFTKKCTNLLFKIENQYAYTVFDLITEGMEPLMFMGDITVIHSLIFRHNLVHLKQFIGMIGNENAQRLIKVEFSARYWNAFHLAAQSGSAELFKMLLAVFPQEERLKLLFENDYDNCSVIRSLQSTNSAEALEQCFLLLSESDRVKFYTGMRQHEHDPLLFSCNDLPSLRVLIKYCPPEYLKQRLSGQTNKVFLCRPDMSEDCMQYLLSLTPSSELLALSTQVNENGISFWNWLSKWNKNAQCLLKAIPEHQRHLALGTCSRLFADREVSVLVAITKTDEQLQSIFGLIPKEHWLSLIPNPGTLDYRRLSVGRKKLVRALYEQALVAKPANPHAFFQTQASADIEQSFDLDDLFCTPRVC